ncbi:DUF397 domain-containing protein [Streptomyces scabiei]|uniref:DUF397 domain-containing protein n=1 Tax=Streptomyces scabiei TaxID=1930 RepID=UPI0029A51736|nr:DUF397 domain-containing protein [Streptomyces scabiei]MDX3524438.1 DUF397 domain-containing protein [Streptomyces scabiei]
MNTAGTCDDDRPTWFTSSYSNGAGGECVECAISDDHALIRDSKIPDGRVVAVGSDAWRPFIHALKQRNPAHS